MYHQSMFSSAVAAVHVMSAVLVFRWLPGTGEDKYGSCEVGDFCVWQGAGPPRSGHFHPIRHSFCSPLAIVGTIKADISRPEFQRCIDNRNEAKALEIPLREFRTQWLLEALDRNIDSLTAAKCAGKKRCLLCYCWPATLLGISLRMAFFN